MDDGARARRAARATWPVVHQRLGDEKEASIDATPSELVAMVHALTLDSWAMARLPLPTYRRAEAPGRLVRGRR